MDIGKRRPVAANLQKLGILLEFLAVNCNQHVDHKLMMCWIVTMKRLGGGVSSSCASANRVGALTSAPDPDRMHAQAHV